ncbi:MAG: hypothetical protein ACREON_00290, partial [Gemmatimonadaceae bacterium]
MRTRLLERSRLLVSPSAVGALLLLVANDLVLKQAFHNWLTGKLSDLAGLFLFALCCSVVFPRRRRLLMVACALAFAWWKSPASQAVIDAWNALGLWQVARVVDVTDLLALLVLPLANRVARSVLDAVESNPIASGSTRRWTGPAMAAACVLAFAATSPRQYYTVYEPEHAEFTIDLPRSQLLQRFYDLQLTYSRLGVPPRAGTGARDTLSFSLPPDPRVDISPRRRQPIHIQMEIRSAEDSADQSVVRLLEATAGYRRLDADTVLVRFERLVVERLRRGEPNSLFYPETVYGDTSFSPRILAPDRLSLSRARVDVALAKPGWVALIEITPQLTWHVIYPADSLDESRLPADSHALVTSCARDTSASPSPSSADSAGGPVLACEVAIPVTPNDVRPGTLWSAATACEQRAPLGAVARPTLPGGLVLIVADAPIR